MKSISATAVALTALMSLPGIGRRKALSILSAPVAAECSGDHKDVLARLVGMAGMPSGFADAWERSAELLEKSAVAGIGAFSIYDEDYPERLRAIPDPPPVLFWKGDASGLSARNAIAIVGTREPTSYGAKVAKKAGEVAASAGFAVVSGLAHGCDTFGHEGCLSAEGVGVAVMAHGLDRVYPAANRGLASRLLEHKGCLISEYPVGVTPARSAFAERDRIQSGLSDGVLVIETDVQGGTMHTVRFARAQKRQIGCIAHPTEWLHEGKTRGNQKLIEDHWAFAVPDGSALSTFFSKISASTKPMIAETQKEAIQGQQQAWAF
ncbi:DNA-processing protein DprA [Paraburkholderia fungorum]|uniref:DNA-processing protein DprA n=1 Tax=Paraburkholderia fungorum TaxID=134537 RepID=UPI00402B219A